MQTVAAWNKHDNELCRNGKVEYSVYGKIN